MTIAEANEPFVNGLKVIIAQKIGEKNETFDINRRNGEEESEGGGVNAWNCNTKRD